MRISITPATTAAAQRATATGRSQLKEPPVFSASGASTRLTSSEDSGAEEDAESSAPSETEESGTEESAAEGSSEGAEETALLSAGGVLDAGCSASELAGADTGGADWALSEDSGCAGG